MKEVSDGFDILVAVIALLFILTVGIWSIASVRSNMDVQVDEKMVKVKVTEVGPTGLASFLYSVFGLNMAPVDFTLAGRIRS